MLFFKPGFKNQGSVKQKHEIFINNFWDHKGTPGAHCQFSCPETSDSSGLLSAHMPDYMNWAIQQSARTNSTDVSLQYSLLHQHQRA